MSRFFRRRKFCRFSAENVAEIDYKDLDTLKAVYYRNRQNRTFTDHWNKCKVSASARYSDQARSLLGVASIYGFARYLINRGSHGTAGALFDGV